MTSPADQDRPRTALVTGALSGIGAALAAALAEAGYRVTAAGLPADGSPAGPAAPGITRVETDVTRDADVRALGQRFAALDLLVNCAGIIRRGGAEFDPDGFGQVIDVNLTGTMRVCAACHPALRAARGAIVNTASMLSYFGSAQAPAYSASKGAVVQLTKSLAIAWAADGIRVNAIAPGWIETPLTAPLRADPRRNQAILDRTPMGRWGRPEDLAGAVLFLASPAAGFITGAVLPVDGGYAAC